MKSLAVSGSAKLREFCCSYYLQTLLEGAHLIQDPFFRINISDSPLWTTSLSWLTNSRRRLTRPTFLLLPASASIIVSRRCSVVPIVIGFTKVHSLIDIIATADLSKIPKA